MNRKKEPVLESLWRKYMLFRVLVVLTSPWWIVTAFALLVFAGAPATAWVPPPAATTRLAISSNVLCRSAPVGGRHGASRSVSQASYPSRGERQRDLCSAQAFGARGAESNVL